MTLQALTIVGNKKTELEPFFKDTEFNPESLSIVETKSGYFGILIDGTEDLTESSLSNLVFRILSARNNLEQVLEKTAPVLLQTILDEVVEVVPETLEEETLDDQKAEKDS